MLEAIQFYSSHTIFDSTIEAVSTIRNAIDMVINRLAISALMVQFAISAPLFYFHHNIFALGFVTGFIFDRQIQEIVEKVNIVYNARRSSLEKFLFFSGGSLIAILTMPTSLVVATLYYSAQWGAYLYQSSRARRDPSPQQPGYAVLQQPNEA